MVYAMITDELKISAEKLLSEFAGVTKELTPHIEKIFEQLAEKKEAFNAQKKKINKEIDNGARITKHRLHL